MHTHTHAYIHTWKGACMIWIGTWMDEGTGHPVERMRVDNGNSNHEGKLGWSLLEILVIWRTGSIGVDSLSHENMDGHRDGSLFWQYPSLRFVLIWLGLDWLDLLLGF